MTAPSEDDCPVAADEALARLMEGNARFLRGEPRFTRALTEVLADLVKGQRPFATILCCSDSRVPSEPILDETRANGRGPHEARGSGVRDRDRASAAACVTPVTPQGTVVHFLLSLDDEVIE